MEADLTQALRGAAQPPAPASPLPLQTLLVAGAGGTLGSAILAEALVAGRFQRVTAVVDGALASAMRGFGTLSRTRLDSGAALDADTAFVVFERARHSNGRDDAFHRPDPAQLLPLAQALRRGGVKRLIVVVPHAPALLPQALKSGFASRDEAAVGALGFEHLVLVRAAQDGAGSGGGSGLERFAAWWLSQLRWMVPQREQPVRAVTLAACVVRLARALPRAAPGSRVLPPEALWQAAQGPAAELALDAWLHASRPG